MCDSVSPIQDWFYSPFELKKERCKLITLTIVALLAIGLATYCYFYGKYPGYNEIYAYTLWGITGGVILCTGIAYLVKAIFSQGRISQRRREEASEQAALKVQEKLKEQEILRQQEEAKQKIEARYEELFDTLFPGLSMEDLESFPENIIGRTGYFDQHEVLEKYFDKGVNVIRGKQATSPESRERPFLAVKLAIHTKNGAKKSAILLIAPNPRRLWYVHHTYEMSQHVHQTISDWYPESELFLEWLSAILKGATRHLLEQDENWKSGSPDSVLIEKLEAPKVSLWQN